VPVEAAAGEDAAAVVGIEGDHDAPGRQRPPSLAPVLTADGERDDSHREVQGHEEGQPLVS
jgi:hypothetical protein